MASERRHSLYRAIIIFAILLISFAVVSVFADESYLFVDGNITEDTIWNSTSQVYKLTGNIQIKDGVKLTIGPGVRVEGDSNSIIAFGAINIISSEIKDTSISTGNNARSASVIIEKSIFSNGGLLNPTGYATYSHIELRDSEFRNTLHYTYIWYPTDDTYITGNTFINCGSLSIGSDHDVFIYNNTFHGHTGPSYADALIEDWAQYNDSHCYVRYNNFDYSGTVLKLPSGYDAANMVADNNYWYTDDEKVIASRIYDKNDDFGSASEIIFQPILKKTEHKYGDWVIAKAATCTEAGTREKVCADCGDKVVEEIEPLGHTWSNKYTVDRQATPSEEGSESIHCTVCDAIKEGSARSIPKTEHKYGEWKVTKAATCTETGTREKVCADCGDKVEEEIEPKGHTWSQNYTVDKQPSATEEGSESIHCTVCDAIKAGSSHVIPKTDHKYGEWKTTKEATCTEAGVREKVCADCGDKVREEIEPKGHTWSQVYTVDKKPSAIEEGYESIHCTICDAIKEGSSRAIPKTEHKYGEWTIKKAATCNEAGIREKVCADCGDKVVEEIEPIDHSWSGDYTVDVPATCKEEGYESIHCKVCNAVKENSKRKIETTDHTWNEGYTIDIGPTSTTEGKMSIHCSVCGTIKPGSEVVIAVSDGFGSSDSGTPCSSSATTPSGQESVQPTVLKSAQIKASSKTVKRGKKTVIKITSDSGTKITIKTKNARAKNKKFVKIKNGKTAKLTFTKNAVKGKYTFTVTTTANAGYKSTVKTISIKVK